jgi:hypothetical protein
MLRTPPRILHEAASRWRPTPRAAQRLADPAHSLAKPPSGPRRGERAHTRTAETRPSCPASTQMVRVNALGSRPHQGSITSPRRRRAPALGDRVQVGPWRRPPTSLAVCSSACDIAGTSPFTGVAVAKERFRRSGTPPDPAPTICAVPFQSISPSPNRHHCRIVAEQQPVWHARPVSLRDCYGSFTYPCRAFQRKYRSKAILAA